MRRLDDPGPELLRWCEVDSVRCVGLLQAPDDVPDAGTSVSSKVWGLLLVRSRVLGLADAAGSEAIPGRLP